MTRAVIRAHVADDHSLRSRSQSPFLSSPAHNQCTLSATPTLTSYNDCGPDCDVKKKEMKVLPSKDTSKESVGRKV